MSPCDVSCPRGDYSLIPILQTVPHNRCRLWFPLMQLIDLIGWVAGMKARVSYQDLYVSFRWTHQLIAVLHHNYLMSTVAMSYTMQTHIIQAHDGTPGTSRYTRSESYDSKCYHDRCLICLPWCNHWWQPREEQNLYNELENARWIWSSSLW